MLAILLNPVITRLQKWKFPKIPSIALALLLSLIIIAGIGYFLFTQMSSFSSELPLFKKKLGDLFVKFQHELNHRFGINTKKQDQYMSELEVSMKPLIGSTLGNLASTMGTIFLLPVLSFLFLYYKTLLLNFIYEVFQEENSTNVGTVLLQTKGATQSYMVGLLLEALIVASLNSVALFVLGIKYAILLGVLGAVLNILPFIGGILAVTLPLMIATVTKDGFQSQFWIIVSYIVIQFFDNHFLVPYVVSARVRINALASIVIVLMGGALWGISGMFLSIPFIGVLKIIFDRVPDLRPWGKLLGDEVPSKHMGQVWNPITRKMWTLQKGNKKTVK
jgi:predicted PurR-regulated permease PerM